MESIPNISTPSSPSSLPLVVVSYETLRYLGVYPLKCSIDDHL